MRLPIALITLALSFSTLAGEQVRGFDLSPDQSHITAPRNEAAIAKVPVDFKFSEPGKLTVVISGTAYPPLEMLATDDRTTIGSDADTARLIADSLGLELKIVQSSWEDWPLGVNSGKYDVVLSNVTVTEARKKRFDFATYRQDVLGFYVKADSPITSIKEAKDVAGLKVIVGSGTNQEKVLLAWSETNEKAGLKPVQPLYYDSPATSALAIKSGRADVQFGPNPILAYTAAIGGGLKRVGLINGGWPLKADIAVGTRKDNGLIASIHTALEGVIAGGQYAQVLERWGLSDERVEQSLINPPGLPD